jgi:hypothetical protein
MEHRYIVVECPHCKHYIYVFSNELNCHIFRHGIFKNNFQQIDPHLSKEKCDYLFKSGLIYGCGKPFKIIKENDNYKAIICDYI